MLDSDCQLRVTVVRGYRYRARPSFREGSARPCRGYKP
jgi:hypothetical protein